MSEPVDLLAALRRSLDQANDQRKSRVAEGGEIPAPPPASRDTIPAFLTHAEGTFGTVAQAEVFLELMRHDRKGGFGWRIDRDAAAEGWGRVVKDVPTTEEKF